MPSSDPKSSSWETDAVVGAVGTGNTMSRPAENQATGAYTERVLANRAAGAPTDVEGAPGVFGRALAFVNENPITTGVLTIVGVLLGKTFLFGR